MLARLSIRDIILIDRLDIEFVSGLSVLTGETGAGKSILLDAFALALGARGDVALVRQGAEQGQVTAAFELPPGHPVRALMAENDIPAEDELILRRVQFADGRTRAFVNDQPLSAQALKALGMALVEIHGQHDERALVDTAAHRRLLDAFGALDGKPRRSSGFGTSGVRGLARWRPIAPRSSGRSARRIFSATRSRNSSGLLPSRRKKPCSPTSAPS